MIFVIWVETIHKQGNTESLTHCTTTKEHRILRYLWYISKVNMALIGNAAVKVKQLEKAVRKKAVKYICLKKCCSSVSIMWETVLAVGVWLKSAVNCWCHLDDKNMYYIQSHFNKHFYCYALGIAGSVDTIMSSWLHNCEFKPKDDHRASAGSFPLACSLGS